jgi:sodium-dependent dicarboxylate transporter 2/3/5
VLCISLGIAIFCIVYFSPAWPDAVDPAGNHFALTHEGKATLGLFALALTWWVAEVVPIGVTAIAIGAVQALFSIRPAKAAFADFMDPSIWFIIASLVIGMTFTKTGLTKRFAYKVLVLAGEKTSMIYLGGFAMVAVLTMVMAHTAVAATVFPLLMAIHSLYEDSDKPTRFGKGLFIGMAFAAAAGSTVSLLGSARAPVALGFFKEMTGRDLSFFEWTYYMLPLGWGMAFLLWLCCLVLFRPEKTTIPGLRERARALYERLGPMTRSETLALLLVLAAIAALALRSLIPAPAPLDRTATMLVTTVLFFTFRILTIRDLEDIPWNIVLLFGGAMSMGTCLWQTGAARWIAIHALAFWPSAHWAVLVLGIGLLVLILTNLVVNVAVIAVSLPVALVMAHYLGAAPEVILFTILAAAGMPFMLLIGAAPNAIAYGSRQFTPGEFLRAGAPASVLLMVVIGLFVWLIWPLMGMPAVVP